MRLVTLMWFGAGIAGLAMVSVTLAQTPDLRPPRIPLGVLGDSDSHAYGDTILLREPRLRGGSYRKTTYQWTEALERLRGRELDQGQWHVWGMHGRLAPVARALGLEGRTPRKRDFRYNFAWSGAGCENLNVGVTRQTAGLLYLMRREKERWRNGVVVIRIGINSVGHQSAFDAYAAHGRSPEADARIEDCIGQIRATVTAIRAEHPTTRLVLVGISDEASSPVKATRWPHPEQHARIVEVLDHFDGLLRDFESSDANIAFFDDRQWMRSYWGGKDALDRTTKDVHLGGPVPVTAAASGNHPRHAVLADDHAGSVLNALWAKDLIALLRDRFGLTLTPLTQAEIAQLVDPGGSFGLAPPSPKRP